MILQPSGRSDHDRILSHGLCGRSAHALQIETFAAAPIPYRNRHPSRSPNAWRSGGGLDPVCSDVGKSRDKSICGAARTIQRQGLRQEGLGQGKRAFEQGRLTAGNRPSPYQYAVDQIDAQLNAAKANVTQSRANLDAAQANTQKAADAVQQAQAALRQANGALANAQANVAKRRAAYDLAKTEEAMAVNLQKVGIGAISLLKIDEAKQRAREQEAAFQQAQAGAVQTEAADQQAIAALAEARSGVLQRRQR